MAGSYLRTPIIISSIICISISAFAQFEAQHIISTNADSAICVYAADLDGDGDMDVLSASVWDDKIAWYENLTIITGISSVEISGLLLYPNPMTEVAYLDFEKTYTDRTVSLISSDGRSIRKYQTTTNILVIERQGLSAGRYILRVNENDKRLKEFVLIVE